MSTDNLYRKFSHGRFDEAAFRAAVEKAMTSVRRVLHNARHPTYAGDVPHSYNDKYILSEMCVRTTAAAVLQSLNLDDAKLPRLRGWASDGVVTLRLQASASCKLDRIEMRQVEGPATVKTKRGRGGGGGDKVTSTKVVTEVTEYIWDYTSNYRIIAFVGAAPDPQQAEQVVVLSCRTGACKLTTATKVAPHPEEHRFPDESCDITWLLQCINSDGDVGFQIQRDDDATCFTPIRNRQVDEAMRALSDLANFATVVLRHFNSVAAVDGRGVKAAQGLCGQGAFTPTLPLMEERQSGSGDVDADGDADDIVVVDGAGVGAGAGAGAAADPQQPQGQPTVALSADDVRALLDEHARVLAERCAVAVDILPPTAALLTAQEGQLMVAMHQISACIAQLTRSLLYVEHLLRRDVTAAIGKTVTPQDFTAYMEFHNRKLLRPEFAPAAFCYAVRRPDHYPEGVIAIEASSRGIGNLLGDDADPVPTLVRHVGEAPPMQVALNAATSVELCGDCHMHAVVLHKYDDSEPAHLTLSARARQFSSFIMMVGRIASASRFEPVAAVMIANKDDLKIPLLLEQIPTPKEFKEAISTLSDEQQRFCKAYRSMQLESTLFGVYVVQIKPQLEKLLKLDEDSLTKEIKLTQDLLDLMTTYSVPSDMLTYAGPSDSPSAVKLGEVKTYVEAMRGTVKEAKETGLQEQAMETAQAEMGFVASAARAATASVSFRGGRGGCGGKGLGKGLGKGGAPRHRNISSFSFLNSHSFSPSESTAGYSAASPSYSPTSPSYSPNSPRCKKKRARTTSERWDDDIGDMDMHCEEEDDQDDDGDASTDAVGGVGAGGDAGAGDAAGADGCANVSTAIDVTKLPRQLDDMLSSLDVESSLRATIIKKGEVWSRRRATSLLAPIKREWLNSEEQATEKNKAFDLLDALSRSGSLSISDASLHVVVAATHCFDKTLMDTIVRSNVNPIDKVERSILIVASAVYGVPIAQLVSRQALQRAQTLHPHLFQSEPIGANDGNDGQMKGR